VVRASHASAIGGYNPNGTNGGTGFGYNPDGSRSQRNTSAEHDIASLGGRDGSSNATDMTNSVANT